jgi:hypothetical protein
MTVDSSKSTYRLYISLLYIILHTPLSLMDPSILLNIPLSYEFIIFSVVFVVTHVSLPYIITGRITVLYDLILVSQ